MTEFRIQDGVLFLGQQSVELPLPVLEQVGIGDGAAVRVEVPVGQRFNRNVFFIENDGATRWQIEESPHGTESDKPFMNLWLAEDGKLVAGNWNGVDYDVRLDSGQITVRSFKK